MKWLVFFLIIVIELHGQESSSSYNIMIEFSDSTNTLEPPQFLNQKPPIWYWPPAPTYQAIKGSGFCSQAEDNSTDETKCVTFTIPDKILNCNMGIKVWVNLRRFSGPACDTKFNVYPRNSKGDLLALDTFNMFQVNAGETYTVCTRARSIYSNCIITGFCIVPVLLPTEFKIIHSVFDPYTQTTTNIKNYYSKKESEYGGFFEFLACADGSLSNFEFIFDNDLENHIDGNKVCPDKYGLRIKEDPLGWFPNLYGRIKKIILKDNGFSIDYEHPIILSESYKNLNIEVFEISTDKAIKYIKLKILKAPVLMVHGLWSNDGAFADMYHYFTSNGYLTFQLYRANYKENNAGPFASNSMVIPIAIDKLKRRLIYEQKVACGKVDIIGHSMGGVLTRLYLQSTFTPYRGDISRIITLNSPHAGSQIADLLLDKNYKYHEIIQELVNTVKGDPNGGAIDNLRVEGRGINTHLNGVSLNKNKVPSHAIITLRDFPFIPTIPLIVNDPWLTAFINLIKKFVGEVVEDMENAFGSENHDWIVPESSQIGGIKGITSVTTYTDINHIESTESSKVISRVLELLKEPINSQYFSNLGYQPPRLRYTPFPSIPIGNQSDKSEPSSLTINSPVQGSSVISGRPFTINITGTNDIKEMRIIISSKSDSIIYLEHTGNSFNLNFQSELPSGVTKILALGKSSNNQIVYKSVNIKVCKSDIYLNNDILSSKEYYADRNIFSNSLITDQTSVRLISGNSITLNPGFEARFGTSLSAKIETCQTVNNGTSINNTDQVDKSEFFLRKENELLVKPNPFFHSAVAEFEINEELMVSLVLIDSNGKIVKQIFNGQLYEGTHKVEFNNFGLKSGIYFLRLTSRNKVITQKVVLF